MKNSYQVNVFWESKFEKIFFERVILKKTFLDSNFENVFSKVAILKIDIFENKFFRKWF